MELIVRKKIEPIILIHPSVVVKTDFLVNLAKKEVGWLGSVEQPDPEKEPFKYLITDIHLFKQTVTGTETDIDAAALGEFFSEHINIADKIRFWGHSHVNMGVTPSGTDVTTIKELQANGSPFFIMGIFNKKQETRFDVYTNEFILQNVAWRPQLPSVDVTSLKKEYEDKVTDRVYNTPVFNNFHDNHNTNKFQRNFDLSGDLDDIDTVPKDTTKPPAGKTDTGHTPPPANIRSLETGKRSQSGHNWSWGNRKQDSHVAGKTRDKKSTDMG